VSSVRPWRGVRRRRFFPLQNRSGCGYDRRAMEHDQESAERPDGPEADPEVDPLGGGAGPDVGADAEPNPEPDAGSDAAPQEAAAGDDPAEDQPEITTESTVEALLFATDSPLPAPRIAQILGVGTARDVKKHIAALNARYEQTGASFRIEELAGGFQMLTLPAYNTWLAKLLRVRRETRLTPAALETLAVVAYRQPALRAEVEAIRGVAVGDVLNRLREMGLVKIVGRAEIVGRPLLYGTTRKFLEVFGLASLDDLPEVGALPDPEAGPPAAPDPTPPAD